MVFAYLKLLLFFHVSFFGWSSKRFPPKFKTFSTIWYPFLLIKTKTIGSNRKVVGFQTRQLSILPNRIDTLNEPKRHKYSIGNTPTVMEKAKPEKKALFENGFYLRQAFLPVSYSSWICRFCLWRTEISCDRLGAILLCTVGPGRGCSCISISPNALALRNEAFLKIRETLRHLELIQEKKTVTNLRPIAHPSVPKWIRIELADWEFQHFVTGFISIHYGIKSGALEEVRIFNSTIMKIFFSKLQGNVNICILLRSFQ